MGTIPSPRGYDRFTDWVLDASQETSLDPHQLWTLQRQETEAEFVDWVRSVTADSDVSEQDLITAADEISREPDFPTPAVPSGSPGSGADDGASPPNDASFEEGPRFGDLTDAAAPEPDPTPAPKPEPEPDPAVGAATDRAPEPATDPADAAAARSHQSTDPSQDVFVTETEYQQFQEKVQQIVQDLIDFLISYDMLSPEAEGTSSDAELKQRLQRAADEADDTTEFFRRIEATLTDLQGGEFDFSDLADAPTDDAATSEQPAELADELRRSITELQEMQTDIESDTGTAETTRGTPAREPTSDTTGRSRSDDPVVLNRLNDLTDIIRQQIPDYGGSDDDAEPVTEREDPQPTREREPPRTSDSRDAAERSAPRSDGRREPTERQARETTATAPAGAAAAAAPGRASRNAQRGESGSFGFENLDGFGSIRQALLPIDLGWLFAALAYGGLDMFTTVLVLNDGGTELNPIFGVLGESIVAFVIWKTLIIFALFVTFYPENPRNPDAQEWLIPVATGIVGAFLTINNLAVFITGSGLI